MVWKLIVRVEEEQTVRHQVMLVSTDAQLLEGLIVQALPGLVHSILGDRGLVAGSSASQDLTDYEVGNASAKGRRRGVTDAPPSLVKDTDARIVHILDSDRFDELVMTEPKPKGRVGRPPRTYRVSAEQWGQAYRLTQLVRPELASSWTKPAPWWQDPPEYSNRAADAGAQDSREHRKSTAAVHD
jgi:hypothetical protein